MPKVVACIIARTVSTRLPLKVLRDFRPHLSMLDFIIRSIKRQKEVDDVYLCTSHEPVDDILEDVAARNDIKIYRGSPNQVIERMLTVGTKEDADILVRITGDNPFTAVEFLGEQIRFLVENSLDYVRVNDLPLGATPELFTFEALKKCNELMNPEHSEYLLLYMFQPRDFRTGVINAFKKSYSDYSLTVDTPEDFQRTLLILDRLDFDGSFGDVNLSNILKILEDDDGELPAKRISSEGLIRMPEGEAITFQEFRDEMAGRIEQSLKHQLYE